MWSNVLFLATGVRQENKAEGYSISNDEKLINYCLSTQRDWISSQCKGRSDNRFFFFNFFFDFLRDKTNQKFGKQHSIKRIDLRGEVR